MLLKEFVDAHSNHAISTEHTHSSLQLFRDDHHLLPLQGTYKQAQLWSKLLLTGQQYQNLCHETDPLRATTSRPDLYKQVIKSEQDWDTVKWTY